MTFQKTSLPKKKKPVGFLIRPIPGWISLSTHSNGYTRKERNARKTTRYMSLTPVVLFPHNPYQETKETDFAKPSKFLHQIIKIPLSNSNLFQSIIHIQ